MDSSSADNLEEGRPKEDRRGSQVRVLHNTRCCIGGVVFHKVTAGTFLWEGGNTVMIPKSEHPLLKELEWLRGYDQAFAANLFMILW